MGRQFFANCSEFQCRVQDCSVQHSHGNSSDDHTAIPYAIVPLHTISCLALSTMKLPSTFGISASLISLSVLVSSFSALRLALSLG